MILNLFHFQKIRSALVSKILPIVQEKCSLISAKVTFNAPQATGKLDDLWSQICAKRDECDNAILKIKGLAFFFSSVAVVEKKVNENDGDDEQDGEDEIKEGTFQGKKKIFWPAMSYWIALQSPDGVRVSTIPIHSLGPSGYANGSDSKVATRLHKRKGRERRHPSLHHSKGS